MIHLEIKSKHINEFHPKHNVDGKDGDDPEQTCDHTECVPKHRNKTIKRDLRCCGACHPNDGRGKQNIQKENQTHRPHDCFANLSARLFSKQIHHLRNNSHASKRKQNNSVWEKGVLRRNVQVNLWMNVRNAGEYDE